MSDDESEYDEMSQSRSQSQVSQNQRGDAEGSGDFEDEEYSDEENEAETSPFRGTVRSAPGDELEGSMDSHSQSHMTQASASRTQSKGSKGSKSSRFPAMGGGSQRSARSARSAEQSYSGDYSGDEGSQQQASPSVGLAGTQPRIGAKDTYTRAFESFHDEDEEEGKYSDEEDDEAAGERSQRSARSGRSAASEASRRSAASSKGSKSSKASKGSHRGAADQADSLQGGAAAPAEDDYDDDEYDDEQSQRSARSQRSAASGRSAASRVSRGSKASKGSKQRLPAVRDEESYGSEDDFEQSYQSSRVSKKAKSPSKQPVVEEGEESYGDEDAFDDDYGEEGAFDDDDGGGQSQRSSPSQGRGRKTPSKAEEGEESYGDEDAFDDDYGEEDAFDDDEEGGQSQRSSPSQKSGRKTPSKALAALGAESLPKAAKKGTRAPAEADPLAALGAASLPQAEASEQSYGSDYDFDNGSQAASSARGSRGGRRASPKAGISVGSGGSRGRRAPAADVNEDEADASFDSYEFDRPAPAARPQGRDEAPKSGGLDMDGSMEDFGFDYEDDDDEEPAPGNRDPLAMLGAHASGRDAPEGHEEDEEGPRDPIGMLAADAFRGAASDRASSVASAPRKARGNSGPGSPTGSSVSAKSGRSARSGAGKALAALAAESLPKKAGRGARAPAEADPLAALGAASLRGAEAGPGSSPSGGGAAQQQQDPAARSPTVQRPTKSATSALKKGPRPPEERHTVSFESTEGEEKSRASPQHRNPSLTQVRRCTPRPKRSAKPGAENSMLPSSPGGLVIVDDAAAPSPSPSPSAGSGGASIGPDGKRKLFKIKVHQYPDPPPVRAYSLPTLKEGRPGLYQGVKPPKRKMPPFGADQKDKQSLARSTSLTTHPVKGGRYVHKEGWEQRHHLVPGENDKLPKRLREYFGKLETDESLVKKDHRVPEYPVSADGEPTFSVPTRHVIDGSMKVHGSDRERVMWNERFHTGVSMFNDQLNPLLRNYFVQKSPFEASASQRWRRYTDLQISPGIWVAGTLNTGRFPPVGV